MIEKRLMAALLIAAGFAGGCGQKKPIDRGTVADGGTHEQYEYSGNRRLLRQHR